MKTSDKLVVMNWKCNPASSAEAKLLASASDSPNVIVCPPAPFLSLVAGKLKHASLGSQDGFYTEGAYTGEYSFAQLESLGVKYAILGHSERRKNFGETSESVSKKTLAAINAGVIPIVCVGERKRTSVPSAIKTVIAQLNDSLSGVPKEKADKIILTYEPVWAISTTSGGRNATLKEMAPVMEAMAERFQKIFGKKAKVLYGGSVNPANAEIYAEAPDVSGVLVGGASLKLKEVPIVIASLRHSRGSGNPVQ
ncbi:MAG: triose-phosphate isomerase [Parcubacteria group bacterium]